MQADAEGFQYPTLTGECNGCGKCRKACPAISVPTFHAQPQTVLAAWLTDGDARLKSSSGGFFGVLVRYTLERGGVVFGAAYDKDFRVRHRGEDTAAGCLAFSGSKYVQSDTDGTYRNAKTALDDGRFVLYSGTPCQIAGLYGFLGGDRENLLTCEVVCNGVPSPAVFAKMLAHLEKKHRSKAASVSFKDKVKGWHNPHFTVVFQNGKRYSKPICDTAYGHGFGATLFLRPVCGVCQYAQAERCADFSLGDFWGLREPHPKGAEKGVSVVLVNSKKAEGLQLPPLYEFEKRPYEEAAKGNTRLSRPLSHNPKRGAFFAVYQTKPFSRAISFALPLYKRVGRRVRSAMKAALGRK